MIKKKCKCCKQEFLTLRSNQCVCSYECSLVYMKQLSIKAEAKKSMEQKKALKEKVKTKKDYEKCLQKEINLIVRLIDNGHDCISSMKPVRKDQQQAGHFYSTGSYPSLRFNLFNIFNQSIEQNMYKSGNPIGFIEGLEKYFGTDIKEFVINLKHQYPVLKLSVDELKEATVKAKSVVKWLKLKDKVFSLNDRIELRHKFNKEIGIYI